MSNLSSLDKQLSSALDILSQIEPNLAYEKICELTSKQLETYNCLLSEFEKYNKMKASDRDAPENLNSLKGSSLENLASYLLSISGSIFDVYKNVRTSTNELDQFATLTAKGQFLIKCNVIDDRLKNIIGECKNYNKAVDVIYVGKFCSLLLTTCTKIGILFSYHGVTGNEWREASGLIKKFYLHKEKLDERYCIIDFNIDDFKSISSGKNLLQIINERIISLKIDTDFSSFLLKHEAEDK